MVNIISERPLQLIIEPTEIDDRLDVPFYHPKYTKIVAQINKKVSLEEQPTLGNPDFAELSRITGFARTEYVEYIDRKEIPFLRVQDIEELGINLDFVKYISYEAHKELVDSQMKPNNLVMTTTGSVGITTVVPDDMECNATQEIIRIKLTNTWTDKKINQYYVSLYCNSDYFRRLLERWGSGSSRPRTLIRNIRKLRIPLLSEDECNTLGDKYKNCIEKRQNAINTFAEIKNIFIKDMGLDFSSIKKEMFYVVKKDDLINFIINNKAIENRIDAKFYNPFYYKFMNIISRSAEERKFEVVSLSDIADYSSIPLPKFEDSKKYKYIRILNLSRHLGIIQSYQEHTKKDMPIRASLVLEENDIITANSGNKTGTEKHRTAIVSKKYASSIGSSAFATLKPKDKKYSSLIYATLRTELALHQIRRVLRGSSTPYLSTDSKMIDDLGNIKIVIPSDDILNKIDDYVLEYNNEMNTAYEEYDNLKNELISKFN